MLGLMYGLVAVGFTLFFGVLDVIKFSHGDVLTVGAFTAFATWLALKATVTIPWLQLVIVSVAAILAMAVLGALIARFLVLPLRSAPALNTLLITLMLGTVLRESVRLFFPDGSNPKPFPALLPNTAFPFGHFNLRLDSMILLAAGLMMIVAVHLVINKTKLGLAIRAVAQDGETARTMGINFTFVILVTFAIGSGVAAFAGVMNGLYYNEINFGMGLLLGVRTGALDKVGDSISANQKPFDGAAIAGVLAAATFLHQEHFAILMMTTAMLLMVAALGLTVQFGFAGVVNFAGAAFLGIGCYTAAVVTKYTALPSWLTLPAGGLVAALIGSILILPVLRTRGHYAALVTIAFGILFKTFLEVNDTLGGPQGIQVKPIVLLGWNFSRPIRIGDFVASFYFSYLLLALALLAVSLAFLRRLLRPWVGPNLPAVRPREVGAP